MTPLKYRIWDNRFKAWQNTSNHCAIFPNGQIYCLNGTIVAPDIFTIQYSTGVKDKNGKDIYEGDILKDSDRGINQVIFLYGCFFLWDVNKTYEQFHKDDVQTWEECQMVLSGYSDTLEKAEVIGNIFENLELLKNK